jgi:hypothetical protein
MTVYVRERPRERERERERERDRDRRSDAALNAWGMPLKNVMPFTSHEYRFESNST